MRNMIRKEVLVILVMTFFAITVSGLIPCNTVKAASQDLFFSEYIEGSYYNKALEIFNGTGKDVNLSAYSVEIYVNGSVTADYTIELNGVLKSGEVYVLANVKEDGNNKIPRGEVDLISDEIIFNGDDAVVLKKKETGIIDCIGMIGEDPGTAWSTDGVSTKDHTLVRNSNITEGDSDANDAYDPSLGWIVYKKDTIEYLGVHNMFLVTFDLGSRGTLESGQLTQNVKYGQAAIAPMVKPYSGYSFAGWDKEFDNVTETLIVKAKYEIKTYLVTFNLGEHGTVESGQISQNIKHGEPAIAPKVIPESGYNIISWDKTFDSIEREETVTAQYARNTSSGLFFSEYIEGEGYNKALEIFNGTGKDIDLLGSKYSVVIYFNGNDDITVTGKTLIIELTGTIEAGDVYVLTRTLADEPILLNQADQKSSESWFNGNDAVVLMKDGEIIDCIGKIGENPGPNTAWGTDAINTRDHCLIRKPIVSEGDRKTDDGFYPSLQWIAYDKDEFDYIGSHDISDFSVTFEIGSHGTLESGELSQKVYYGQAAIAPAVIPNIEYNFVGWDRGLDNVTNNLIVKAEYESKKYKVTFDSGVHGKFDSSGAESVQIIKYGKYAIAPTVIPDSAYNFIAWDKKFDKVTETIITTAQYKIKTYIVTFEVGEHGKVDPGGAPIVQIIKYGQSAVAPTVIPDAAYKFTGGNVDFNKVTKNLTVTAQYEIIKDEVPLSVGTYVNGEDEISHEVELVESGAKLVKNQAANTKGVNEKSFLMWVLLAAIIVITIIILMAKRRRKDE